MKQTERAAQSAGSRVLDFVVASAAPLLVAASAGVTAAVLRRHSRTGWPLFVGAGAAVLGLIALAVTALDVPTYPPWLEYVRTGTLGTVTPSDDYAGTIDDGVGPGWYLILITGLLLAAAAALRLRQWSRRPAGPNPPD